MAWGLVRFELTDFTDSSSLETPRSSLDEPSNQTTARGGAVRGPLTRACITHLKRVRKGRMSQPIRERTDEKLLLGTRLQQSTDKVSDSIFVPESL